MFQKQILNLRLVFPLCYFLLLAHCNFLLVHKYLSVCPPCKTEHSRSAWSMFLSWGMTVAWAATTSRMQWTSVHHTSPVSYSLGWKAPLIIIIKVIKRRKYIVKCTLMTPQSSSAKERFGHSGSSWCAAHENGTAEGRTAIRPLPAHSCSWYKMFMVLPSLHFSFSSSMRTTWTLDHFSQWSCRERIWKTWVSGQWDCPWVMCWEQGGGSTQPCPL